MILIIWEGDNLPEGKEICKCEVYSRVVGYLSPVSEWNKGKKEEFHDRQHYNIPDKRPP